jgi:hypothetical protein
LLLRLFESLARGRHREMRLARSDREVSPSRSEANSYDPSLSVVRHESTFHLQRQPLRHSQARSRRPARRPLIVNDIVSFEMKASEKTTIERLIGTWSGAEIGLTDTRNIGVAAGVDRNRVRYVVRSG